MPVLGNRARGTGRTEKEYILQPLALASVIVASRLREGRAKSKKPKAKKTRLNRTTVDGVGWRRREAEKKALADDKAYVRPRS